MTQDEHDQIKGRNHRLLADAEARLSALMVKGREIADVLTAVAEVMRERPSSFRAVKSASHDLPSRFRDFSAGELSGVIDVFALNEFAQEVALAEDRVRELTERYEMSKGS
jgi:hypothetical protein